VINPEDDSRILTVADLWGLSNAKRGRNWTGRFYQLLLQQLLLIIIYELSLDFPTEQTHLYGSPI
jgi:hypothetical protein